MTARDDDPWVQILLLLRLVPDLVSEAVADAEDPEAVLAELQDDIDATLSMADDPVAPRPFGVVAALLRRVRDCTAPPPGLDRRLEGFECMFRLLRDLDAHHRLPPLAA
jgi:hypothetical protein